MREAKTRTSWIEPDSGYESAVLDLARAVLNDETLTGRIAAFVTWITPDAIANSLGAKLVQLTMPGVPDIYQGCELAAFSLVDPDNRRPVDFARRRVMLAALDETSEQDAHGHPGTGDWCADCPGSAVAGRAWTPGSCWSAPARSGCGASTRPGSRADTSRWQPAGPRASTR